jgi:hypothetical protein
VPPTAANPSQKLTEVNATIPAISTADSPHAEYMRKRTGAPLSSGSPRL